MNRNPSPMRLAAATLALAAGPLAAEIAAPAQEVMVDISALRLALADRLGLDAKRMPHVLYVPAGVAVEVCRAPGGDPIALAAQPRQACAAERSSQRLESAVRDEVRTAPAGR